MRLPKDLLAERPATEQPRNPFCKMAYRRICGVCVHFTGPDLVSPGHCARFDAPTLGRASAATCEEWGRKTKGASQQ